MVGAVCFCGAGAAGENCIIKFPLTVDLRCRPFAFHGATLSLLGLRPAGSQHCRYSPAGVFAFCSNPQLEIIIFKESSRLPLRSTWLFNHVNNSLSMNSYPWPSPFAVCASDPYTRGIFLFFASFAMDNGG